MSSSKDITQRETRSARSKSRNNKSDEEPPPAKKQRTTDPQTSRTRGAHDGGQQFEMKMAGVIGLRGMKTGDNFELATNVTDVGNFDDIVYKVKDRRYFLQLKHTENPGTTKFVPSDLVPLLQKCFESYCSIIQKPEFNDIPNESLEFIIYTNRHLGPTLSEHKTKEVNMDGYTIFKTSDQGETFNFIPDDNKKIDVYTLLENSVKEREENNCLSNAEKKSKLKKIKEFLNKLIIFTGQKDQCELDDLIEEEIINQDANKFDRKEYKSVLQHFKERLENWWRKRKDNMTPENLRDWLKKAKTDSSFSFVRCLYQSCTQKLGKRGIKFSDSEMSRLRDELSDKRAVHLRSDALTLCSKLLLDCLPQSRCILVTFESLQSNTNMLLHAWVGGHWEWLIVFCDPTVQQSDISEKCLTISEPIKTDNSTKRAIILTACSVQKIKDFFTVEHKFKFEQLSKESQKTVLDKKIDFQGCKVTMGSVLQQHGNVQHVLGPELVKDLVTEGTAVNIGGRLQQNTGHYEPRFFKRKIWLPLNILRNQSTYPDIFAVSGMVRSGLVHKVPADENVGYFYFDEDTVNENSTQNDEVVGKRFIVLDGTNLKSSFLKLRDIRSGNTLHWLKYKDKKLLWKETCGDTYNLRKCFNARRTGVDRSIAECMKCGSCEVNEESIWKLKERTVLVVAEPGMGKSSTTTQVAWNTKLADPTSWVVRINWNDHTRELQEIDAGTFNFDSLVKFLCSTAFPESKYTDINSELLKEALENNGNVTVLIDGFDEISPTHADKATVILRELMKTKVQRIWVTSRPVQKEKLEKELSAIAFNMTKLSNESQINVFMYILETKAEGNKKKCLNDYVERFLKRANVSLCQRNFTGCPLHITMIASAFEGNLKTTLDSGDISLPEKLDLLKLYDKSIERKLDIYETEKKREDLTNASVQDDQGRLTEIYKEILEKSSLLVTLPSKQNPLSNEETNSNIQSFLETVQAGKDKIGIVMNVVKNRPHFVHRTFAEYFTALWFSKNFMPKRRLLKRILFDSSYGIVKDVFDRILARGWRLHCAVLDWDTETVEKLLKEGYYVNAVDDGGRTALHLIAAQRPGDSVCEEITNSLMGHKATVNINDKVLDWTPLQYARQTGNKIVEQLLLGLNVR